ncbi:MAG: heme ABC transporter ATP-binding protein [Myxococcales bacterium]|nr:heme ABC transporter ATP-binding protein [Myxococcales bacterium]
MALVAEAIEVRRGRRTVLHGVDLSVAPGELVALVGPNGAGKSTLLAVMAGDLAPQRGRVCLDGRPLSDWSPRERARRRAVLPQASSLDFPFTVAQVVLLGRIPHFAGAERPADRTAARDALAQVGLAALADRPYPALSGGERQRVHLARVLAQVEASRDAPRYLLLDEPTASQDLRSRHLVLDCARRFADAGGGVLAVLHDLDAAARYADRIALLADGRALADGPPAEVLVPATLEAAYQIPLDVVHPPGHDHPVVVARATTSTHPWRNPT